MTAVKSDINWSMLSVACFHLLRRKIRLCALQQCIFRRILAGIVHLHYRLFVVNVDLDPVLSAALIDSLLFGRLYACVEQLCSFPFSHPHMMIIFLFVIIIDLEDILAVPCHWTPWTFYLFAFIYFHPMRAYFFGLAWTINIVIYYYLFLL